VGDGAKTRRRILDVTWRLLSKDPSGTRMEDVAQAAGISRQALYLHFPDRAALLVATAAHGDEVLGFEEATRPVREAKTAVETLDRLAEFWGDYLGKVYDVALALEALRASDAAVDAAVIDRERNRMQGGTLIAGRLDDEGVLAPDLSRADAAALIVALGSYHLWAELTRQRGWSKRRYVGHVRRLLHRALLAA
jgi:AcrR family transcriptional regulator